MEPSFGLFKTMVPGKKRRNLLLKEIIRRDGLAVNCKWMPPTSDKDIQSLLKDGVIKMVREPRGGRCKRTILKIA